MSRVMSLEQISIDDFENCRGGSVGDVSELKKSIEEQGLLTPILVREKDGVYYVRAGFRRYHAIKQLAEAGKGIQTAEGEKLDVGEAKVSILACDEMDDSFINFVENIHQEKIGPIQIAKGVAELVSKEKPSEVARKIGKSQSWVSSHVALANGLCAMGIAALEGEYITLSDAIEIAKLLKGNQEQKLDEMLNSMEDYKRIKKELQSNRDPRMRIKPLRKLRASLVAYQDDGPEEDYEYRQGAINIIDMVLGLEPDEKTAYHPKAR